MPANLIKKLAKEKGKTVEEVEVLWDKAKEVAKEHGHDKNWAYIVGILKKMLGIEEDTATTLSSTGLDSGAPESGSGKAVTFTRVFSQVTSANKNKKKRK